MNALSEQLPQAALRALGVSARVLPAPAMALGAAIAANLLLAPGRGLRDLSGKRLRLELTSPPLTLGFVIHRGRMWPAPPSPWHACIRGTGESFLALLLQKEDADALFFDRRLCVEGDTELALQVRHAVDAAFFHYKKRLGSLFP